MNLRNPETIKIKKILSFHSIPNDKYVKIINRKYKKKLKKKVVVFKENIIVSVVGKLKLVGNK